MVGSQPIAEGRAGDMKATDGRAGDTFGQHAAEGSSAGTQPASGIQCGTSAEEEWYKYVCLIEEEHAPNDLQEVPHD